MTNKPSGLERSIPAGAREKWAADLAQIPEGKSQATFSHLFQFRVGAEWFGIDPASLAMTIPYTRPRMLPHQRGGLIEGLVNADGRVILCLSLARFAGTLPALTTESRRLLVFSWQKWTFAMAADEILGVENIDLASLDSLPSGAREDLRQCARGVAWHKGRAVVCLDATAFCQRLLEVLQ